MPPLYSLPLKLGLENRGGVRQGAETRRILDLPAQREQREKRHAYRGLGPFSLGMEGEEFTLEKVQLVLDS